MKKVTLIGKSREPKGAYSVHLGNGTTHTFSNEKKAQHFLNNTGKFLNECLYSLRKSHKDVLNISHDYWGFFDTNRTGKDAPTERELDSLLQDCQKAFNLVYCRSEWANGNHFAFLHLYTVCTNLKNAISILTAYSEQKRLTIYIYQFKPVLQSILSIERDLNQYGQDKAAAYFTRPQHRDLDSIIEFKPNLLKVA